MSAGRGHGGVVARFVNDDRTRSRYSGSHTLNGWCLALPMHKPSERAAKRRSEPRNCVDLQSWALAGFDHPAMALRKMRKTVQLTRANSRQPASELKPFWQRIHEYHCYHDNCGSQAV